MRNFLHCDDVHEKRDAVQLIRLVNNAPNTSKIETDENNNYVVPYPNLGRPSRYFLI